MIPVGCVHDGYPECRLCGKQTVIPEHVRSRHPATLSEGLLDVYKLAAQEPYGACGVGSLVRTVLDMHMDRGCREFLNSKAAALDLIHELLKLAQHHHDELVRYAHQVPVFVETKGATGR